MQFINDVQQKAAMFAKDNAAVLLTAGGVVGTVTTAVLSWRGGYKTATAHRDARMKNIQEYAATQDPSRTLDADTLQELLDESEPLTKQEQIVLALPSTAPAVLMGGATIASIIMSHRVSAARAAALAAAYGLAERNLSEYKAKVSEKLTGPKNAAIGEEISQDRVNQAGNPPNMVIIGEDVLCFDESTDRYFHSSMEKIRGAVNKINEQIHNEDYADASDFYHLLGMKSTEWSNQVGWNRDNMLELKYDTVTSPDGRPCLAIAFANFPRPDFIEKHT